MRLALSRAGPSPAAGPQRPRPGVSALVGRAGKGANAPKARPQRLPALPGSGAVYAAAGQPPLGQGETAENRLGAAALGSGGCGPVPKPDPGPPCRGLEPGGPV